MKYDFFGALEAMAATLLRGTQCLADKPGERCLSECLEGALETDRRVCELEEALAGAFLPPLDRGDALALAHGLRQAVWCVYDTVYLLVRGRTTGGSEPLPTALPAAQAKAIGIAVGLLRHPAGAVFHPGTEQFYRTCYLARHRRADSTASRALTRLCEVLGVCYETAVETVMRAIG